MSWSPTNGALAINTQTAIQIFLSQGLDFSFGAEVLLCLLFCLLKFNCLVFGNFENRHEIIIFM